MAIDLAALPDDVETLHRMIGDLATALDSERVRAQAAIDRLTKRFPNAVMVHTPVHASWLNPISVNRPSGSGRAWAV